MLITEEAEVVDAMCIQVVADTICFFIDFLRAHCTWDKKSASTEPCANLIENAKKWNAQGCMLCIHLNLFCVFVELSLM